MSTRSHSQTSNIFVTVYGFLGNRLCSGLCNVYDSCMNSHDLISCLEVAFEAAASFRNVENAAGLVGE